MEAKKKSNLSIVHIDTTSSSGGAAKVARRLAEAQRHSGYRSEMLVGIKEGNSPYSVSFESNPDPFMVSRYKRKGLLDYEFRGSHELMNNRRIGNADIIHFHNLHGSYFNPFSIVLLSNIKPSVWTLHDMQSFTGHCAHSFDCEGWMEGCPKCRFLSWYPHINEDSASALWMDKKWIYDNSRLHIVTPSKWLKEKVEKSILKNHPVHLIYNGINTSIFKPNKDKKRIREELGFPENAFLFGSAAKGGIFESFFKGGNYAKQVVSALTSERKDCFFINIGARCKSNIANVIDVPWVSDEHFLSKVLSVLDAFIFTSIAENCPLAVLEALACGLPVVAFSIGGVPELVREGIDGFLMERGDWRSMVTVLKKLADEPDLRRQIGINTRARVLEEFDHAGVTERYEKLYHDCLSKWEDNSQGREVVGDYPEIVLSAPFAGYRSRLEKIFRVETTNSLASSGFLEVNKDEIHDTGDERPGKLYQRIHEMIRDGEQNKAMVGLEKLLESDPDYALAHNDLGVLYYNQGEKEKALNHYRKAADLQPENITFQKNLADFYYVELSQVEEAMQIYVKVLNANPEDVETLLIIGQICVAIKKFDDAKDFYSRILIVEPWNKDAKQFLEELEKCQLSVTGDRFGSEDIETASKEYLVSAIVSTYNSERFLRGCLEDLEAQTIADRMEVIVVNSGTEQNEETIVREFQQRYNNIKYIKTDDRETVYQAWNRGIRASKAKYITNANTDDRRYADSIEVLVNVLEENPDIVLAYGNFKVTDTENCISGNANIIEEMDYPPYERGTLLRSCYPGPMPVWRKSVHDEFGYFNESFVSAGDREFWCRISQKYSLLHVKKHIGVYYRNPEGIENRNKRSGIVQQEAERISRRYAKSFQLPWNDFRRIDFHIEDNFPETKRALQELESSGGGFHVHVQINSCDLGEYLWLRQKRNEGLVHKLSLTQEGKRKFPSVAILMFTYNRLEYTQEALHTLMTNTRYPFDLYIVDNHSTDGTREWLEDVRLEYPDRIKDIRYNSTNEGLPGPTNDFWSRVDSELLGKVDNDTLVPTGWLERLVEAHQKIPELAVIGGYHFRPEDFDDKSARSKLYEHDGIKILPDAHIGGCCYLMKKSIQKIFGPMKFNPALKIHGWTEYQHMLAGDGYIVGYIYPLIQLEYMDDPRSEKCLINEKYQDYTREIWRERGINFKSTDQVVDWLHRDARRITNQPSSVASSLKSKNHKIKKSYYGYARPEIQAIVSRKAKKILDIGCGAGVLGKELKNRQKCYVAGIEYLPEAANKAETVLDRVYMGDAVKIMPEIPENSFDTIIMADFIEHVANPEEILLDVKRILTSKGKLVLSIPNIRHWSVIKDLLEGRWEYQDAGILDKTHIRFFTWQSILSLLNSAGYHIDSYSGTYLQGYDVPEEFINLSKQCGIDTSTLATEGRIYQYLITCTLKSGDELPESIISKQNALHDQITSIIILTLNQLEYTKKCIDSVFKHTKEPFELIVVDNGSTDRTVEFLESEVSARNSDVRVKVIRNRENLGFAAGNNQGMAAAMGDYILLMNNDIVVTPNWLERMVLCAEKNPKIGIVGPMSNYVSGPQFVKDVTYNTENLDGLNDFALEISNKNSGKAAPFWRVVGFCMLIKKAVIDKIGGLDVRYGLGNFEDDDFSLRATLAGYESRIVEDCFVHHFGNRTFLAAQIDYKKSLHKNWEIFKEKWGIPKDVPYGSSYDLSFLLKDGFIHSKHYFSIGETPDLQISKGKGILSSSIQEEYLKIEQLIATGKKQEAKKVLEKLLLDDPEFAMAHNDLGVLYFQAGDKDKALKHYERAVQLQPVSVTFLKNLADFYYVELERVEDAMKLYVKILYLNSKDKETLLIMGHICVSLKKFDDAKEFYNRVLEIDPLNEDARQVLDKMLNHEQPVNPDINVSIIIPTSGQQKYIKKCVESIKKHTTQPHEIMFVNNGAAKGTTKWLKQCLRENFNYHMVKCPKDTGFAGIVNEGIKASTGEYILLLSNDVVVTKDWLNRMLESLKSTHDAGVVGPMSNNSRGAQKVSIAENISLVQLDKIAKSFMTKNRYRRISSNSIDGFCMLFARDLVEKIGLFDEQFGHDGYENEDFCLRAVLEGHINLIAGDVYVHRQNTKAVVLNKKFFNRKWNNADSHNLLGKKFLALTEIEKGREAYQRGNIDDAVELFLEGIRLSSGDKWPYYAFAEMLLQAKNCKDAIDIINEIPQDEQDIRRIELLGYCKEGMDLDQEAFGYADHALSINGDSAAALNLKGLLAFKQGEIRFAEDYFKKAIEADPGYGEPYTNLGAILWDSTPEDALDLFERGFLLSPMIPDIVTNYHSAITASGEYERAGQVFEEAGLLYPNSKMIKYQFIDMLIKQGKNTEAMHQIEDAIALFGADDGILQAALKIRKLLGPTEINKVTKKKSTVSLCMIVKNEEKYLAKCLRSIKPVVDEMIVVDTGSTDMTKDIAKAFGAKVYDFEWNDDFSEARNFSISKAYGKWNLVMDADETISSIDYNKFKNTIERSKPFAYQFTTRNYTLLFNIIGWNANDEKYINENAGVGWTPSDKVRLFPNKPGVRFEYPIHELIEPSLKKAGIEVEKCKIPIHHYGKLNQKKSDNKGEIYYQIGRKKLDEMGDDEVALCELAIQAETLGKHEESIELWERLIKIKPETALAFANMGTAYAKLGKYEKAVSAASKALEIDPEMVEAHYNYAFAKVHFGQVKEAILVLEKLINRFSEYPPAQFLLSVAYCLEARKTKWRKGFENLRLTMGPGLAVACHEFAKGLVSAKRPDYAVTLLEAAIESKNSNKEINELYSECLEMMNVDKKTGTSDF